jgi:hypothetical protein
LAVGPVQLLVLGFRNADFHGEIIAELERMRDTEMIRVIDALAVYKDKDGNLEVEHLSDLSTEEAIELGSTVAALIGLEIDGEEAAPADADPTADGAEVFDDDEWDVLDAIPPDSAAALILIEHHWAVPLRDAVVRAGGYRLADAFVSPLDLVSIGLLTAEEARRAHEWEKAASVRSR